MLAEGGVRHSSMQCWEHAAWEIERMMLNAAGQRVARILEAAHAAGEEHRRRITTATINMVIRETVNWRAPPTLRGSSKKGRIYYATQACIQAVSLS